MSESTRRSHPENDLSDDADYANLYRPDPESFDDLADQEDPAVVAERNRRSSRQAWQYLLLSIGVSLAFALVLGVIFRFVAGVGTCEEVGARLLCTPGLQKAWAVAVSLPPIAFLLGAMVILTRKVYGFVRWRPWMGVFWVEVLFTMWVVTITVQVWLSEAPAI